jgi:hypothetical protein
MIIRFALQAKPTVLLDVRDVRNESDVPTALFPLAARAAGEDFLPRGANGFYTSHKFI